MRVEEVSGHNCASFTPFTKALGFRLTLHSGNGDLNVRAALDSVHQRMNPWSTTEGRGEGKAVP